MKIAEITYTRGKLTTKLYEATTDNGTIKYSDGEFDISDMMKVSTIDDFSTIKIYYRAESKEMGIVTILAYLQIVLQSYSGTAKATIEKHISDIENKKYKAIELDCG
jgi:hypothetical protein